jgi:hypothetical protein
MVNYSPAQWRYLIHIILITPVVSPSFQSHRFRSIVTSDGTVEENAGLGVWKVRQSACSELEKLTWSLGPGRVHGLHIILSSFQFQVPALNADAPMQPPPTRRHCRH